MTKTYWDFSIKIRNFSASTALDSRTFKMINYPEKDIIFRRGMFNIPEINIQDIKQYTFYSIKYMEVVPCDRNEAEVTDIIQWLNSKKYDTFSIRFDEIVTKNVIKSNIRFFDLDIAYHFRLVFDDYIVFDNNRETIRA